MNITDVSLTITNLPSFLLCSDQAQHFAGTSKLKLKDQTVKYTNSTVRNPSTNHKTCMCKTLECPKKAGKSYGDKICPSMGTKYVSNSKIGHFVRKRRIKLNKNNIIVDL